MNLRNFFAELKRRNVYKVAIAYGVVAWLLMQVASQIFPFFEIPNWAVRLVVLLLIIGFPVALILAWAFELTPEGIKRAEDVDLTKSTTRRTSHKLAKTLMRVRHQLRSARSTSSPPLALSANRRFSVRCGYRTTFIAPEQIDWIEASGNYAILHVNAQNHLLRETMVHLESVLPPAGFMRVSRSAIVHLSRVKEIQTTPRGHHFAVLHSGMRVCVTKSIREVAARLR